MADLIEADDGLPAGEVGIWAKDKHSRLRRYLDISRAARKKFLAGASKSAAFIDLFCGHGRARVKQTGEWIDGSAVAAWKISLEGGAPFSDMYVADRDPQCRAATVERLKILGAPVRETPGTAIEAAATIAKIINPHGLHFAFVDPFSLGALDFQILRSLARIKRVDMLVHVSAMDLQRNLDANLGSEAAAFDAFAPGWRENIDTNRSRLETRRQLVEYWRSLVEGLGKSPSERMELITGNSNQPLYWLLLIADSALAHRFWNAATHTGQGDLF